MPVKIKNPVYPFELRKQRIQGEVVVEFWVEIDGKVVDARAIKSPHPDLSKAAVEATVQSEYLPGMKDGQPKRVRMQVPIMFAL